MADLPCRPYTINFSSSLLSECPDRLTLNHDENDTVVSVDEEGMESSSSSMVGAGAAYSVTALKKKDRLKNATRFLFTAKHNI
jgi:hypothetical protein